MKKKEVMVVLKRCFIPIILLSWTTSFLIVSGVKYFNILPKNYVIQSQLVVNPKITDKKDSVKSMDLLKYNENYSLLVYNSSFLDGVIKKFNNEQFKKSSELKSKIKVLYSATSQVLTLQVNMQNEQDGIKLANILLKELRSEGNKQFVQCDLSVLSYAFTTNEFTYSASLLLIIMSSFSCVIYLSVVLFYNYRFKYKYKHSRKIGVINDENKIC